MFKSLEEANDFELKATERIKELESQLNNQKINYEQQLSSEIGKLNQQIANQETVINSYKESEVTYKNEIDRLKIANYNYFEQISQQRNIQTNNNVNQEKKEEINIDYILNNLD